jgi:diguanylate cyclase (GGDEF)-like protein
VLVAHDAELADEDANVIDDTVTQAAPVLANMKNLAIAEAQASTDSLTGLANRRSVQDTVRRMVAQSARTGAPLAVLAIDIDHFKRINDRFGHDRGDDVLAAFAQTLSSTLRASDFAGRQGGEEFVALLPDTDLSGAMTAAENLRAAVEAMDVLGGDPVTASFGVAVMPEDGSEGQALLRQADRALYAAKANGRNRVETAASGVRSPLAAEIRD